MTVRYQHDCDACRFLGEWREFDLYVCARKGVIDTVIARYGSEGSNYASGTVFGYMPDPLPELKEALDRALAAGYRLSKLDEADRQNRNR